MQLLAHVLPANVPLALSSDKCPALDDFVAQIKGNSETSQLFESVQADVVMSVNSSGAMGMKYMDLS